MMNYSFKVGASLKISDQDFFIQRILNDGKVQLEAQANGMLINTTLNDLLKQYEQKKLSFLDSAISAERKDHGRLSRPLSTFPEKIQNQAIRKKQYIDFILGFGAFNSSPENLKILIAECANLLSDSTPPSPTSVYRWHKALIANKGDYRVLVDRYDRRGGLGSRLHPEVQELLQASIDRIYMTQLRESGSEVYFDLLHRINKENELRLDKEKLRTYP